ncbi:MFS transporter [Hyphomicrobium sp.]|uniref:MFS transporter n=1 Tax=Hyphomicrobium sp. TaxID=82 RepID=UPI0025C1F30D|nr:MFS transporter [Hyphomicrobium sp.]
MGWDAKRSFGLRVALFYGALFVFYGMHTPFLPVWLNWRGLSAAEMSAIIAAPLFLRIFVSPLVAMAADNSGLHRRYLVALAWLSLAFVLMLATATAFWPILLLATALMLCNSTIMPLIETIAVAGVRHRGLDYGRMRLWGSLTFVGANFLGGFVIAGLGGGAGIWLVALGCLLTTAASHILPPDERFEDAIKPATPLWKSSALHSLLAQREFCVFLVAAGLVMAAHAMFFTFGILIWEKQGLSAAWCGTLWALGVAAEVVLFAMSGRAVSRVGAARLIVIGAAASIVRWAVMAFDPPLAVLIPLQLLHGATYGASHIGAIHFIHHAVARDKQGTAQALYATIASGVAMGCATLIAGWLYGSAGSFAYFAMVAISAISLASGVWLDKQKRAAHLVGADA